MTADFVRIEICSNIVIKRPVTERSHRYSTISRLLTVIDVFTREALAIEVGHRLRGENVANVLNRLVYLHGRPKAVFCDNDAEFTGQIMDLWA